MRLHGQADAWLHGAGWMCRDRIAQPWTAVSRLRDPTVLQRGCPGTEVGDWVADEGARAPVRGP